MDTVGGGALDRYCYHYYMYSLYHSIEHMLCTLIMYTNHEYSHTNHISIFTHIYAHTTKMRTLSAFSGLVP